MTANEPYEHRELTEEDLQSDREALEQLRRGKRHGSRWSALPDERP